MGKIKSLDGFYQKNSTNFYAGKNPTIAPALISSHRQSFGRSPLDDLSKAAQDVYNGCAKKIDGKFSLTRLYQFLDEHDCEIQKQLINAAFTGTVAPVVIGFNPLTAQKKETKQYLAWRQPLSAVIAVAGGIMITMPFDSWIASLTDNGLVERLDTRIAPDKYKLSKLWKVHNKKIDGVGCSKAEFAKIYAERRRDMFASMIAANPSDVVVFNEGKDNIIKLKTITAEGEKFVEIGSNIPLLETQAQVDAYIAKHNLNNMKFRDFLIENLGISFYKDGDLKPEAFGKQLDATKARLFLEKIGIKGFDGEDLARTLNHIRQKKTEAELAKILHSGGFDKHGINVFALAMDRVGVSPEIRDQVIDVIKNGSAQSDEIKDLIAKNTPVTKVVESFGKLMTRVAQHVSGESGEKITLGQLFRQLGYEDLENNECSITKMKALFDQPMAVAIDILKNGDEKGKHANGILKGVKGLGELAIDGTKSLYEYSLDKIAKNITKDKARAIATKFKTYKAFAGILLNLVMIVFTCSLLNWIYPRFMDKYFPHLSPQKNGGKK